MCCCPHSFAPRNPFGGSGLFQSEPLHLFQLPLGALWLVLSLPHPPWTQPTIGRGKPYCSRYRWNPSHSNSLRVDDFWWVTGWPWRGLPFPLVYAWMERKHDLWSRMDCDCDGDFCPVEPFESSPWVTVFWWDQRPSILFRGPAVYSHPFLYPPDASLSLYDRNPRHHHLLQGSSQASKRSGRPRVTLSERRKFLRVMARETE